MSAYILNTSFHMDEKIASDFIVWAKESYIKAALACGIFKNPVLTRILTAVEPGTASFALHLATTDVDSAGKWHDTDGAELRDALHQKYGQRIVFFSTYMEEVE